MTIEERLEREQRKHKHAKETIANLLANIGEYKKIVETEREQIQEERQVERQMFVNERSKYKELIKMLEKEKDELFDACEDYEKQIKEQEEDKSRRNKETMVCNPLNQIILIKLSTQFSVTGKSSNVVERNDLY